MLRRPSKWRRLLPVAWLSAIVGLPAAGRAAEPAASPALQDIAELEQTARAEAQRLLPPLTTTQRLVVGPLQPQLQLARCASPIRSARAPGIQVPGRVLIELRCDGSPPWHLYVPARVVGTTPVVLAAHAIAAGALPRHHSDPFDRMLVAQARLEHLVLVTRDSAMAAYDVQRLGSLSS